MSVGVVNKTTGDRIPTAGIPAIDDALDLTSVNPVQNAIITAALAGKQNALTAGDYVSIANNGTISVTQSIGVYDVYSYVVAGRYGSNYYYVDIQKYKNGVLQSNTRYVNDQTYDKKIIDDRFSLQYNVGGDFSWHFVLLTDSNEHKEGESIVWRYNVTKDFTETFNVSQDSSTDLATKGDVNTAIAGKQDTLTFDDTPTDNSNNPVKSNGIYDALVLKQDATDNSLDTEAKTIVGAINEHEGDIDSLKSGLTNVENELNGDATTYPYADVITIPDAVPSNLADCSVKIEPVQDLHGQSAPYVGGAGKNKLPLVLADIKAANTGGTWNDNVYTINSGTITVNTDDGGNVTSIKANGTFSADVYFIVGIISLDSSAYILNGCPSSGGWGTYLQYINGVGGSDYRDTGTSVSFNGDSDSHKVFIRVIAGTVSNIEFLPMIRLATETDATFAPYTNICPISGHTEASVQRTGKNLCYAQKVNNTTIAKVKMGYTYTFSCDVKSGTIIAVNWFKNNMQGGQLGAGIPFTFTADEDFDLYINGSGVSGGTFVDNTSNYQLELGSTATPFEPFRGKTYTIALGSTIYGGTVDFDSGVMTVDRAGYTFDGSNDEGWSIAGSGLSAVTKILANVVKKVGSGIANIIADKYISKNTTDVYDGAEGIAVDGNGWIRVASGEYTESVNSWITYLASNPLQVCYELATPTTVQLTPQQIQLLKGQNTIYASTGQISVTVNGVSGSIGQVQEQVNEHEERIEAVESDSINLLANICSGVKIKRGYKGYDADVITFDSGYYIFIAVKPLYGNSAIYAIDGSSTPQLLCGKDLSITQTVDDSRISLSFTGNYMNFILVRLATKADFTDEIHLTVATP